MPTLNAKQIVLIILAMLGFTATGIQQLEPVIGHTAVLAVGSICTFVSGLMAAALSPFLSTSNVIKDASSVPGVDVQVSRDAPQQVAALAADPDQNSIAPAPGEERAVLQKAGVTV